MRDLAALLWQLAQRQPDDDIYQIAEQLARIARAAQVVAEKDLVLFPLLRRERGRGYKGGFGWLDFGKSRSLLELALALQGEPPDDGTWNGEETDGMEGQETKGSAADHSRDGQGGAETRATSPSAAAPGDAPPAGNVHVRLEAGAGAGGQMSTVVETKQHLKVNADNGVFVATVEAIDGRVMRISIAGWKTAHAGWHAEQAHDTTVITVLEASGSLNPLLQLRDVLNEVLNGSIAAGLPLK